MTVFFVVVIPLVVYYVYTVRVYYEKKEDRLMDELSKELIARRDAEREARCQRAEIERLTKKVATLDDGRVVQYACRNKGDDDNPKWVHLRAICREKSESRFAGDVELSIEFELKGGEDAQTRMRSIHLCMKDLRELVKTI